MGKREAEQSCNAIPKVANFFDVKVGICCLGTHHLSERTTTANTDRGTSSQRRWHPPEQGDGVRRAQSWGDWEPFQDPFLNPGMGEPASRQHPTHCVLRGGGRIKACSQRARGFLALFLICTGRSRCQPTATPLLGEAPASSILPLHWKREGGKVSGTGPGQAWPCVFELHVMLPALPPPTDPVSSHHSAWPGLGWERLHPTGDVTLGSVRCVLRRPRPIPCFRPSGSQPGSLLLLY